MFLKPRKRDDDLKAIVDWCTNVGKHTAIGVKISPVGRPALAFTSPVLSKESRGLIPSSVPLRDGLFLHFR